MADDAILAHLLRHSLWASQQMVGACRGLTADQLETDVTGTYGRLSQTLIHLARAQGGYLRRLTDWQPGDEHRLEPEEPFPGVERIFEHLRFTGERLIAVAERITADRILHFEYEGRPESLPAWVVLLQSAEHATEHRQQIATALTLLDIEPPEPDLWAYWDALQAEGAGP